MKGFRQGFLRQVHCLAQLGRPRFRNHHKLKRINWFGSATRFRPQGPRSMATVKLVKSPPQSVGRSGASSLFGFCWFTSTKARSLESYGELN